MNNNFLNPIKLNLIQACLVFSGILFIHYYIM